ncbi:Axial budding pattern 2 [Lecanosticta acicola]|uniref:Axial budding pattern 2 n=1 Tax=Lecanosticta acicola TaxID=111012 RepID=A0AAI8Z8T1_9PEZI|nr:Axial budding pattern 2 [Lecanosticta acicola]
MAPLTASASASASASACILSCILFALFVSTVTAAPTIAFPFNSQVPTVARVGQEYQYELSSSTFTNNPIDGNLTYSLSAQPAWLTIDPTSGSLSGKPGASDAGNPTFLLTAADSTGAAHLECTLVVSSQPAPRIATPASLAEQLARAANLSQTSPVPVVTLLPQTAFAWDFQQSSFIDIVQRRLFYYATLRDHTPLPSWLRFSPDTLRFSGDAPELSAFPQSWGILLIASDVEGFAGTEAQFTVAIGTEQLVFVPGEVNVSLPGAGGEVDVTSLGRSIWRNGVQVHAEDLRSANVQGMPSWLSFDEKTLELKATVPEGGDVGGSFTVAVQDDLGNRASVVVNLVSGDANSTAATTAGAAVGGLPTTATSNAARTSGTWLASRGSSTTTSSSTSSSSVIPSVGLESARSNPKRLDGGVIAAIVILSILGTLVLLVALIWCLRRRRRDRSYVSRSKSPTPEKNTISRPILPPGPSETITITTELQRDVEKNAGADRDTAAAATEGPEVPPKGKAIDPPPQIHLNLPLTGTSASAANNRTSRWSRRFSRISQVSSIGAGGDEMLRHDSNIPELGASVLHTAHDSFSVPTEMARVSRHLSQTSPSKTALQRLREKRRSRDRDSVGLGISTVIGGGIARHSSKRAGKHRRGRSSFGGLSMTREASSVASLKTCGTSVLSTKASEFPLPPRSTHSTSLSVPTLSIFEADPKRKSIRLVERSDSIVDNRPIQDKRQSYIRNRASTNWSQSPLFAHGSRAESKHTTGSGSRSGNASSAGSVRRSRRSKNGKSMNTLATYSESSSLEPQMLGSPRRAQRREQKRLSQRVRSAFPENYPRVISRTTLDDDTHAGMERDDSWDTIGSNDWVNELSRPRHERSWVLPDEASPTPPPAAMASRQQSRSRNSTPSAGLGKDWRRRLREKSSSPLSSVKLAAAEKASSQAQPNSARQKRLSEPMGLVSVDSLSKARPRIAHTKSRRPVSVEEVQRLSSMKAEQDTATTAGSERWDDIDSEGEMEGAGLISARSASKMDTVKSARSDLSGPAFL